MITPRRHWLVVVLGSLLGAGGAFGQCDPQWQAGGWQVGSAAQVLATTTWDPDGPGPFPEQLVVAGDFHQAGPIPVSNIAAWDGVSWRALGAGFDAPVRAVAVFNGELYACGEFTRSGSTQTGPLARWTGSTWVPTVSPLTGTLTSLTVFRSELIVGGYLPNGGQNADSIGGWNGSSWRIIGGACSGCQALAVYNDRLIAAAGSCVKSWDGTTWTSITSGISFYWQFPNVYAMTVFNGHLILSADVALGNSISGEHGILQWDGVSWARLGTTAVYAPGLQVVGGSLYAAGTFVGGPNQGFHVSRWNGSQWEVAGMQFQGQGGAYPSTVGAFQNRLVAGGFFQAVDGVAANAVAILGPQLWEPLGPGVTMASGAGINVLAEWNGELYAGGTFAAAGAGTAIALARRSTSGGWQALGSGLGYRYRASVFALVGFENRLIVGGEFETAGGLSAPGVAAWDGDNWSAMGQGLPNQVYAFAVFNGKLIAGGNFSTFAGAPSDYLAQWDGTQWSALPGPGFDGAVTTLAVHQGELFVGGAFSNLPFNGTRGLVRWDGATWRSPGSGMSAPKRLLSTGTDLYAAGSIDTNPNYTVQGIARWNGTGWTTTGTATSSAGYVATYALESVGGDIIVGGAFTYIDGVQASNIARWDGSFWHPVGSGISGDDGVYSARVSALTLFRGSLVAGGIFRTAGGAPSQYLAQWGPGGPACYANCDCSQTSPVLTAADFTCFLNRFALSDQYANCDGSNALPALNVNDFMCFLNAFAAGCP